MSDEPESAALQQAQALQALPADWAIVKVESEAMMAMAAARPRNLAAILKSIEEQVELSPSFAAQAIYSKPVGKESYCATCRQTLDDWKSRRCERCGDNGRVSQRPVFATGLSIRAAEAIAEAYGYNEVRARAVPINPDMVSVEATFVDYQRGRRFSKNALVSRFQKRRGGEVYRLTDERFQLLQDATISKVVREVIVRSVPPGLRAQLEQKVRSLVRLDDATVQKLLTAWGQKGVTKEMLESFLGKPRAEWAQADRLSLLETFNAVSEGESTVESIFAPGSGEEPEAPAGSAEKKPTAERVKEKLSKQRNPEVDGDPPPPGLE